MVELLPYEKFVSRSKSIEERLWSGAIEGERGCWVWQRSLSDTGYGRIVNNGQAVGIHRLAYELAIGPIPEGLVIDHLCFTRSCINPEHLEPVTHKENTLRGSGVTAYNANRKYCVKGHAYDEENTHYHQGRRYCRICVKNTRDRMRARQRRQRQGAQS